MRKEKIYYLHKIATTNLENMVEEIIELSSNIPISVGDQDTDFIEPYISFIQDQLIRMGFDSKEFPFQKGIFDEVMKKAIKIVEESINIPPTGDVDYYSSREIFSGKSIKPYLEKRVAKGPAEDIRSKDTEKSRINTDTKSKDNEPSPPISKDIKEFDPRGILNDSRVHPKVREMANKMAKDLQSQGFQPFLLDAYRSIEGQLKAYQRGASKVKFGWHNTGLAIDVGHHKRSGGGSLYLEDDPKYADRFWSAVGKAGLDAGFSEWGGNWQSFIDKPHLQYNPKGISLKKAKEAYDSGGIQEVWNLAVG